MDFTVECGACSAIFTLEVAELGQAGAKITCPQCHTFFYLKTGSQGNKKPIIEKLAAQDGPFEENLPPPLPGEKTTETILSDALSSIQKESSEAGTDSPAADNFLESSSEETQLFKAPHETSDLVTKEETLLKNERIPEIDDQIKPVPSHDPFEATGNFYDPDTIITKDSLAEYPEDRPRGAFDQIILWTSSVLLLLAVMLFLNYKSILPLPGLEALRENVIFPPEVETPAPNTVNENGGEEESTDQPQYGFPDIK